MRQIKSHLTETLNLKVYHWWEILVFIGYISKKEVDYNVIDKLMCDWLSFDGVHLKPNGKRELGSILYTYAEKKLEEWTLFMCKQIMYNVIIYMYNDSNFVCRKISVLYIYINIHTCIMYRVYTHEYTTAMYVYRYIYICMCMYVYIYIYKWRY